MLFLEDKQLKIYADIMNVITVENEKHRKIKRIYEYLIFW